MFLLILFVGSAVAMPIEDGTDLLQYSELAANNEASVMSIVPSGYSPSRRSTHMPHQTILSKNENVHRFLHYYQNNSIEYRLTFNIYDDKSREATIALYRLLRTLEGNEFKETLQWAQRNINRDMYEYIRHLLYLYNNKIDAADLTPPFIAMPNYFINSETIWKAMEIKLNNGEINEPESISQIFKTHGVIRINTNYSGWNLKFNGCEEKLNYFREDIGLNSYYYGVHLRHPFWMSNNELDDIFPGHSEHLYFVHKHLLARYLLEKEHLKQGDVYLKKNCHTPYNSYLIYTNGLSFPVRVHDGSIWNEEKARIKTIDIALKECISRGLIFMGNAETINITETNYIDEITKLIRANLDGIKTAKIVRHLYGYGSHALPINRYNPAPSILHHPQTSLRDPQYWYLIQYLLDYFKEFQNTLTPFKMEDYSDPKWEIVDNKFTELITIFKDYQFNIDNVFGSNVNYEFMFTACQRRLHNVPFILNFTVNAKIQKEVVVRLFLGPSCLGDDCWKQFDRFYLMDIFVQDLNDGYNNITWSPRLSTTLSDDNEYNLGQQKRKVNDYDVFKFPANLIIPRGQKEGLEFTLFIIITPVADINPEILNPKSLFDGNPLGFPFHRSCTPHKGTNFKFYNITVFHKEIDTIYGQFSPHLY